MAGPKMLWVAVLLLVQGKEALQQQRVQSASFKHKDRRRNRCSSGELALAGQSAQITVTRGLTAFLGRQSQEGSNPNEVSRTVAQITCHPDYNIFTSDNNICLLKLSSPVTFTNYIRPVCLAAEDSVFHAGTINWVTGWGNINFGVPLPSPQNLQEKVVQEKKPTKDLAHVTKFCHTGQLEVYHSLLLKCNTKAAKHFSYSGM
ncbi:hypothetical protein NHX12_031649, partial [Muraenolepis orangiensis]